MRSIPFPVRAALRQPFGTPFLPLSITCHSGPMKKEPIPWLRYLVLFVELCLIVASVMAPLVFSSAVLSNFLAILEAIARAS